jgi:hypothetical protein
MILSFHGKKSLKSGKLRHLRNHRRLEHLKQGVGFESNGSTHGCAIGCLFDRYEHSLGPELIGLPESILRLADHIFESLPAKEANLWAVDWLAAVPVNVPELAFARLADELQIFWLSRQLTQIGCDKFPAVQSAITAVINLLQARLTNVHPPHMGRGPPERSAPGLRPPALPGPVHGGGSGKMGAVRDDPARNQPLPQLPNIMSDPLDGFFSHLKAMRDESERIGGNLETELHTLHQKFRLEMTALVDDPKSAVTEKSFRSAFVAYSECLEEIYDRLTRIESPTEGVVARHLIASLTHFLEKMNLCHNLKSNTPS